MRAAVLAVCQVMLCTMATAQDTLRTGVMHEVVVTGTGTRHLLANAPVQTEVITAQQLRQAGASSIEDILATLTASFAFAEGDMGSQMQLGGLGNSYILILIDGKRMHGDVGGENDLTVIDPHAIEKIEIVKGAASALYGSDAIAGVVNIITRKERGGIAVEDVTRVASYADLRQHNTVAFTTGDLTSQTNFHMSRNDGWQNTAVEHTPSSTTPITDSHSKTVNAHTAWSLTERLSYSLTPALELYAEGMLHHKDITRPRGRYPKYDVKNFDLAYANASASAGARWQTRRHDVVTLDVDWARHAYSHVFTATTLAEGFDGTGQLILDYPYFAGDRLMQSDQRRTIVHLKGVFTLPARQRLSAGAEGRFDYLRAPTSVAAGTATDDTEALYLQDELRAISTEATSLLLTAGARLTRHRAFGLHGTPKLSALWRIGNVRLRTSWSKGFKSPTLKEQHYRYIREMNAISLYLGNRDLRPQTSTYYSIGAEYTLGRCNISATAYRNELTDMIALVTVDRTEAPAAYREKYGEMLTHVRRYANMEDARTTGIDVNASYTTDRFTLGASYAYLDTEAHAYDTGTGRLHKVTIDGMAHHRWNAYATCRLMLSQAYGLGLGLYARGSSRRYYQVDGNGRGYTLLRFTTTHDIIHRAPFDLRIEAGVDNILDYVDRTPHGLHLGTTTPGRTVYAALRLRFKHGKTARMAHTKTDTVHDDDE